MEQNTPAVLGPVESSVGRHAQTVRDLIACCHAWEPDARILGNVRAADAAAALSALVVGLERYETARRMNTRQWAAAWKLNISTGKPFDEIVDDTRPFLRPNVEVTGLRREE